MYDVMLNTEANLLPASCNAANSLHACLRGAEDVYLVSVYIYMLEELVKGLYAKP